MPIEIFNSIEIKKLMEKYLEVIRPPEDVRKNIDYNYEIEGQSIILNEIRPSWRNPEEKTISGFAKVAFVKKLGLWKIFWKRSDLKFHQYKPVSTVKELEMALKIIDEDTHCCFHG